MRIAKEKLKLIIKEELEVSMSEITRRDLIKGAAATAGIGALGAVAKGFGSSQDVSDFLSSKAGQDVVMQVILISDGVNRTGWKIVAACKAAGKDFDVFESKPGENLNYYLSLKAEDVLDLLGQGAITEGEASRFK